MTERIVISGFGGQGIMFLGKLIAWAAMRENKFVTFFPAYGAEVRGGTSHCSIIISDKEIASPCADEIDTLIAMNSPSLEKFLPQVINGSEVFVNGSMVENVPKTGGINLHCINFTDIASGLGNAKSANMVALGAYLSRKKILSTENIVKMLPEVFKNNPELVRLNEQAIKEGLRIVTRNSACPAGRREAR